MLRPMAPELIELGDTLQEAAQRDLRRRRRARRQAIVNGLAGVALVGSFAAAGVVSGLPGTATTGTGGAGAVPTAILLTQGDRLTVGHIPDETVPAGHPVAECLGSEDCRIRIPWTLAQPMGKV